MYFWRLFKTIIMRKIFLLFFITTATLASAQIKPQTIGMKMGGGNWFTFEASYQYALSSTNRLEFNLGILSGNYCAENGWDHHHYDHSHNAGFSLSGAYHWVIPIESDFNWYIGPSVRIGSKNEAFLFGLAPQVGVEYNFNNIPLQLCTDMRTGLGVNRDAFFLWDFMVGVRYAF